MVLFGQHAVGGADLCGGAAAVQTERGVMIGFSRLQFPESLRGRGVAGGFASDRRFFWRRQKLGAFEQPAEIFFAGDLHGPFLGGEAGHGFIFHLQPFEPDDADILRALLPGLALAEFHD